MEKSQSPLGISTEVESKIGNLLKEISSATINNIIRLREQWVEDSLRSAGLNPEDVHASVKMLCERLKIEDRAQIDQLYHGAVQDFYSRHNIQLYIPEEGTKEFLLKDDTPIGVWDTNYGFVVDGEKLKISVQKWVNNSEV